MNNSSNKTTLYFIGGMIIFVVGFIAILILMSGDKNDTSQSNSEGILSAEGSSAANNGFLGKAGDVVTADESLIYISESDVDDGNIHHYNYYSDNEGKTIYFFVIKADDGTYRVAANACEVCHDTKKGFTQVGDLINCDNCGTTYSKNQIAQQKGGCNPGPIDKDANIEGGELAINVSDVEAVAYLF